MTRSTREKWLIAIVAPLIVGAAFAFFSNLSKAASKEELNQAKVELKSFTISKVQEHAKIDSLRDMHRDEKFDKMDERLEFLYLRELKLLDEKRYLQELLDIKYTSNQKKLNSL